MVWQDQNLESGRQLVPQTKTRNLCSQKEQSLADFMPSGPCESHRFQKVVVLILSLADQAARAALYGVSFGAADLSVSMPNFLRNIHI